MPAKTFHTLERLGAIKVTLGPTMLFASQCVVLIHYELDRRSLTDSNPGEGSSRFF
jgi:tRNA (pseudouridine54-N1)-methyltransferase